MYFLLIAVVALILTSIFLAVESIDSQLKQLNNPRNLYTDDNLITLYDNHLQSFINTFLIVSPYISNEIDSNG